MDYNTINSIIQAYLEGETTLEEEKVLQEYFAGEKVAPEHLALKKLFDFYQEERSLKNPNPLHFQTLKRRKNYKLATAAVLVLGLGLFGLFNMKNTNQNDAYADTKSKKEIYKEVKKYSSDLNKGIKQLSAFGFIGNTGSQKKVKKDSLKNKNTKK